MTEEHTMQLLEKLLDECEKHELSMSLEYDSGYYITGDGIQGRDEPTYSIFVGNFGAPDTFHTRREAILYGLVLLDAAKDFDYDAYADELIAQARAMKGEE